MNAMSPNEGPTLFTVGHSNHTLEQFFQLLNMHAIQVVVDTRSHPYSKYVAHFNREELNAAIERARLRALEHFNKARP